MGKQIENSCQDTDAYQNRIILEIIVRATNCRQLISTLLEFKLLSHVYIAITARAETWESMGTICTSVEIMINNNNNKHR